MSQRAQARPLTGRQYLKDVQKRQTHRHLFEKALENCISICPGPLYSPSRRYRNFVRLSFGHPWTDQIDAAIQRLGDLVGESA